MNPWVAITIVLAALGGLIGGLALLKRRVALAPETSRKVVHLCMGLVCMPFPWLFAETWPVIVLGAASLVTLTAVRLVRSDLKQVLHGVERKSYGDLCYPIAVVALFLLYRDRPEHDWVMYVVPLLLLAVGDAVGAIIGLRYGQHRYTTDEGHKSLEGSLALFITAFLGVHIPLLLYTDIGRLESLLVALIVAFIVTLVEAIAWRGLDNLFVPLGTFLLLDVYRDMPAEPLAWRLAAIVALVALAAVWSRRTLLRDSNVLAAALALYLIGTVTDWTWMVVPVGLCVGYSLLCARGRKEWIAQHNIADIGAIAGAGLSWMFLAIELPRPELFAAYGLSFSAQMGIICVAYNTWRHPTRSAGLVLFKSMLCGVVFAGLPQAFAIPEAQWPLYLTLNAGAALLAALLFWVVEWKIRKSTLTRGRHSRQFLYGAAASLLGLLVLIV